MTTSTKIACLFLLGCAAYLRGQDAGPSPWTWKGYVKNVQQWTFTGARNALVSGGLLHNRLMLKYAPDSVWTFDLELRNRLLYGEGVRQMPGLAEGLDTDNGLVDLSFVPVRRPGLVGSVIADRLWAQWQKGAWTLRAGRQRIHWGMALTWNPNDWFNAWNFLDFDYEERPGTDALRVQYQPGGFSQFDLAISLARTARRGVGALRYGGHVGRFDWQALAGVYRNRLAAGTGWAGDLGKAGVKAEISYFHPIDTSAGVSSVSATAEVSMLVKGGWMLSGALLLNSNGLGGRNDLLQLTEASRSADNLMPGKVSALATVSGSFTPLLQGTLSALYSPNGQLLALIPTIAWSVAANWDVDLTGQLFWLNNAAGHLYNAGNGVYLRTRWSF